VTNLNERINTLAEWMAQAKYLVAGSSLVVHPAATMPEIAHEAGAKLVIIMRTRPFIQTGGLYYI